MNNSTTNKPRLLYVLHCYNNRAGTEMHTKLLARSMSDEFEVAVLYPERGSIWLRSESTGTTTEYKSQPVPFPISPYNHPPTRAALAQALKDFAPDILHVQHFIYWPLSLLDQLIQSGVPIVVSFHDYFTITPYFTMQGARTFKDALASEYVSRIFGQDVTEYLTERLALLTDSISKVAARIVPSHYLAQTLSEACALPFRVIEHGIPPLDCAPIRYADPPFRFGFVGSLLPQKGWRELYEAFPEVRKTYPNTELHLFGGGEAAPSNPYPGAFFHGAYEPEELPNICSRFNVGVLPSLFAETHSLVLSELWRAGIPVAASNIGAFTERIKPGINGQLFDPTDSRSITEALKTFLASDNWRTWKIAPPREAQSMVDEYRTLYRELRPT